MSGSGTKRPPNSPKRPSGDGSAINDVTCARRYSSAQS